MNHRSGESVVSRSMPLFAFLSSVLLVLLSGPSIRVLARQSGGSTSTAVIKVTHIAFNHKFEQRRQGPATGDALSIRTNWDSPLTHGPFLADETPPGEAGAGEWIVDPSADGTRSARNNAALYLRESRQHAGSTTIMVRFEATNVVDAQIFSVPSGTWPAVGPVTVSFDDKIPGSELNKYSGLDQRSSGGNPESYTTASGKTSQDYITFTYTEPFPNSVQRSLQPFLWFAQNVHLKDGSTIDKMTLNISGLPNPNDVPAVSGHELFTMLDTPELPWYDTDEHTNPWVIALRDVTNPHAALGQTTLPDAGRLLAIYLFGFKGFTYDTMKGAPHFSEFPDDHVFVRLQDYIRAATKVVNCYDQAAGLASYINLVGGNAQFRFKQPFGFIKAIDIVGIGRCNNPFLKGRPQVLPSRDITRTKFANHAYPLFGDKIYDACAGPEVGVFTELQYWMKVIDEDACILFDRVEGQRVFDFKTPSELDELTIHQN